MSEDDLLALIEQEEANCVSSTTGALAEQRRKAMQYYYGQPYGNEVEGRSQVVTTEVKDAVEGILPSLMAIFTSSDEIVRFEPQSQEDEQAAQQATDYVNYIFTRLNNGFLTLYCLFKDALLQKNGYAKIYWEDYTDQGKEEYENLTDDEFASFMQDPELELIAHEAKPDELMQAQLMQQMQMMAQQGLPVPEVPAPMLHHAVFRRSKKYGKVCVDPVPPEEVLISRETPNDITKARFVEHRTLKTISDIRKMGFDIPDDIQGDALGADFNMERVERMKFDDDFGFRQDHGNNDPSTKTVWLCEAYLYVDYDKDGIAEYRKITKVGRTILDNVEFDSLSIVGGTAVLMPHKHYGLSLYDLVGDIQLIKSTITRNLLDNAYVANNGRMVVLDGMVNMDDLLTSRPNGIVRAKAMNAVQRLDNPLLGAPFYNLLEYFDRVKTNRVGARDFGDAVDPDALNAKAHTAELVRNAAQERINLMARIFAETVVKQLFWKILELICKHQQKPQTVKLRNRWVQIDPREWKNKFNMTVTVGLGTGSQGAVLSGAMGIMSIQQGMVQLGLMNRTVSEGNIYQAAKKYAKAVFPKDADSLFSDPEMMPPPQPQPNVDLLKIQFAAEKAAMGDRQKRDKMMLDWMDAEANRQLALKQMGIDVIEMVKENRMHNLDQQQESYENDKDRAVDLMKHKETLKHKPRESNA